MALLDESGAFSCRTEHETNYCAASTSRLPETVLTGCYTVTVCHSLLYRLGFRAPRASGHVWVMSGPACSD